MRTAARCPEEGLGRRIRRDPGPASGKQRPPSSAGVRPPGWRCLGGLLRRPCSGQWPHHRPLEPTAFGGSTLVHVPQSLLQRAWPSCSRIHTRAPGGPPAQGPALGAWPGHILLSQAWGFLCDWTPYTRTLPDFSLWGSGGNNLGSGAAVFWRVSWYNFCQG